MRKTKQILSVVLCLVMVLGVVPAMQASAANGVKAKLDVFMQSYPSGSRWTGSFAGGRQCFGFGKMAIYNVFGTTSGGSYRAWDYAGTSLTGMTLVGSVTSFSSSSVQSLLSNARCGDILQFNTTKQHTMIVYAVNSSSVTIYDCNWDNNCGISLRDCSFGTWSSRNSSKLSLLRADNYDEINGSDTSHDPTGTVDHCNGGLGFVSVGGWAFDSDDTSRSLAIDVYIGGDAGSDSVVQSFEISANIYRSDVNNAYSISGNHGFDATIDANFTGTKDVYIYALNVGDGWHTLLGVYSVTVTDPSPCGAIDHCEGGNGYIDIGGWAFDPDDTSQSLQIHVYIGADSSAAGGEVHSIVANLERIDVNNAYHAGNNHGYNTVIYTSKTGNQPVYIYAINIGRGGHQLLGSPTVYITPHTHSYTGKVTTAATCTTNGVRTYTCACGASYTETITALGHSYGAWTKLNDTQHQRVCSRNSSHVEKANHTWNNGTVTKAATCSATGVRTYTCSVCNGTKTETIAVNSSNHVNTTNVSATASTCTVKGYTAGVYCNDCKQYISGHEEQPLAVHTLTTINQLDATCTAEGYTGDQYCTTCKQTVSTGTSIPINTSNHVNTTNVSATASTCTVKGFSAGVYCNDCKRYISGHQEQPLAAHTTELRNAREATCTAEGYTGDQYCTTCKQTVSTGTAIGKKAHTLTTINQEAAGCTTAGYTGDQYCTACKQTISKGSATNALGHTAPDGNGNCTRCGAHIKDVTQPTQPQPQPSGGCKYCGGTHSGPFGWLIQFFHNILAIFKR